MFVTPQLEDHFWVLHLNKDVGKLQVKVTSELRGLENTMNKRRAVERELLGLKGENSGGNVEVYYSKISIKKIDSFEGIENLLFWRFFGLELDDL